MVIHQRVNVATMVESMTLDGVVPFAHVITDASVRSVEDLSEELRRVKDEPRTSTAGRILTARNAVWARFPLAHWLFYRVLERSASLRSRTGTIVVTSVGMFGEGGGFGITPPTLMSLTILIGGIKPKPLAVGDAIEIREVMDLTASADHAIVDGAPFARFVANLRALIENPDLVGSPTSSVIPDRVYD